MSKFNWKLAAQINSGPVLEFLKDVHDKPLSEDEYVELYMKVPKISKAGNQVVRHEKTGRQTYHRLKERFGFFGGTN